MDGTGRWDFFLKKPLHKFYPWKKNDYLDALALQFVDSGQGAGGSLKIHEAVSLAAVGGFIKNSLCRDDRAKSKTDKKINKK